MPHYEFFCRSCKKTFSRMLALVDWAEGEVGHTPLSVAEDIPWNCKQLVIGTGAYGRLPVMEDVKREAQRRHVELLILPTAEAIETLGQNPRDTNAILHVTC